MHRILAALALIAAPATLAQTVDHPLNVGGEVKPPVAIYTPSPEYTKAMLKERSSCPVVALVVDEQGKPHDPHVVRSSGSARFDQVSIKTVADYRFRAASLRGTPVAVRLNTEICVNPF